MALLWESLATREVKLLQQSHARPLPDQPATAPGSTTCAATTTSAGPSTTRTPAQLGINGYDHRRFLNAFYTGRFPGSFAPRPALPGEPTRPAMPHLRHVRLAGRSGKSPARERPARGRAGRPPHPADPRRHPDHRRHPAALPGRRNRHAQRLHLPRRPGQGRRQPLGAPPVRQLGEDRPPQCAAHIGSRGLRRPPSSHHGAQRNRRICAGEMSVVDADNPHVFGYVPVRTKADVFWFWRTSASGSSRWRPTRYAITA